MNANDNAGLPEIVRFSDEELHAYIAGELDDDCRARIEGYLACNPDLAARVMGAMHRRGRRAQAAGKPASLRRTWIAGGMAAIAACAAFFAFAGRLDFGDGVDAIFGEPEYVEDAVMSRRATLMRVAMASQTETTNLDAAEIDAATQMRLPHAPASWRLVDAQLFPSEEGPSMSLLYDDAGAAPLHLFVVRADTLASEKPSASLEDGEYVAYWEIGGTAYALSGGGSRADILARAELLATAGALPERHAS